MPTGSPVVCVGVNKAANAGIFAMKILSNEFSDLRRKLKIHKEIQFKSVLQESEQMKKEGIEKFVKKRFS